MRIFAAGAYRRLFAADRPPASYRYRPDSQVTPGGVRDDTADGLASPDYSKTVRPYLRLSSRQELSRIPISTRPESISSRSHSISLEQNRRPPTPPRIFPGGVGAAVFERDTMECASKDKRGDRLHVLVCAGRNAREQEQREIAVGGERVSWSTSRGTVSSSIHLLDASQLCGRVIGGALRGRHELFGAGRSASSSSFGCSAGGD